MDKILLKKISAASFRRYGKVIEYTGKAEKGNVRNLWRIIFTEKRTVGWRIAYLVLRDKNISRLEMHPNTFESFEPVKGRSLFFVAQDPQGDVECFLLDKPVVLKKGIWHGLVTLGSESEIKITENSSVTCRYHKLNKKLNKGSIR